MPIIRLIIIAALIGLALTIFRRFKTKKQEKPAHKIENQNMVKCHHCGLHLPEPDAIKHGEHFYCSKEHAEENIN